MVMVEKYMLEISDKEKDKTDIATIKYTLSTHCLQFWEICAKGAKADIPYAVLVNFSDMNDMKEFRYMSITKDCKFISPQDLSSIGITINWDFKIDGIIILLLNEGKNIIYRKFPLDPKKMWGTREIYDFYIEFSDNDFRKTNRKNPRHQSWVEMSLSELFGDFK